MALMQVARAVIGFVVMAHYPLNHNPARKGWEVSIWNQWVAAP